MVWIAFFRGINVTGNNILPMKDLSLLLKKCKCANVKTYIQSGNAVFKSSETDGSKLARRIENVVFKKFGFTPKVLLITGRELEKAAKSNPFREGQSNGSHLHLNFLWEAPRAPDLKSLEGVRAPTEKYALKGKVFYFYAPGGMGPSKLRSKMEKYLGGPATSRNWNTVVRMIEMVKEMESD